jgi:hypothetical protein
MDPLLGNRSINTLQRRPILGKVFSMESAPRLYNSEWLWLQSSVESQSPVRIEWKKGSDEDSLCYCNLLWLWVIVQGVEEDDSVSDNDLL